MTSEKTPPAVSDAEVEALISDLRSSKVPPVKAAADMIEWMQRGRLAAETRSAAAVLRDRADTAKRIELYAESYESMAKTDGVVSARAVALDIRRNIIGGALLEAKMPSTPAALASLLAAARADALREAVEAVAKIRRAAEAYCADLPNAGRAWEFRMHTARDCETAVLALIAPTPPAGGADNAE